jgi:hypothetical protein
MNVKRRPDILALENETEGLLSEILGFQPGRPSESQRLACGRGWPMLNAAFIIETAFSYGKHRTSDG